MFASGLTASSKPDHSVFFLAVFQFSYTAVFGAYTAFIFLRTGASVFDTLFLNLIQESTAVSNYIVIVF